MNGPVSCQDIVLCTGGNMTSVDTSLLIGSANDEIMIFIQKVFMQIMAPGTAVVS